MAYKTVDKLCKGCEHRAARADGTFACGMGATYCPRKAQATPEQLIVIGSSY